MIVNGPVKASKGQKVYLFRVSNLGDSPITVDPDTDIAGVVNVNGTPNGSVTSLAGTKTIRPGGSVVFPLRWTQDGTLSPGDTVEFTACVNLAGDSDVTNNCDSETRTAVGKHHPDHGHPDHGKGIKAPARGITTSSSRRRVTDGQRAISPLPVHAYGYPAERPCGSHLKRRDAMKTPATPHSTRDATSLPFSPSPPPTPATVKLEALSEVVEREDPPISCSQLGSWSIGMKMPEMNESITIVKGPIEEAVSSVVVNAVIATPRAQREAVPSRSMIAKPGRVSAVRSTFQKTTPHRQHHGSIAAASRTERSTCAVMKVQDGTGVPLIRLSCPRSRWAVSATSGWVKQSRPIE